MNIRYNRVEAQGMPDDERMKRLLQSHAELRAALLIAGKEIRRLSFGKSDNKVLGLLRRTLRE